MTEGALRNERRLMTPEGVPLRIELAEPGERIAAFLADIVISTVAAIPEQVCCASPMPSGRDQIPSSSVKSSMILATGCT